MSYTQVETLIKEIAGSLQEPIKVGIGRSQEINKFSQEDVLLWTLKANYTSEPIGESNKFINTYSIELFFYMSDLVSNNDDQTNLLIDKAQQYSFNFMIAFLDRFNDIEDDFNTASINGVSTSPVYKAKAKGVYSGVLTTFSLSLPDDFVYCLPLDEC